MVKPNQEREAGSMEMYDLMHDITVYTINILLDNLEVVNFSSLQS